MTPTNGIRRIQVTLLLLMCMGTIVGGCSNDQPQTQETTPTETNTNNTDNTNNTGNTANNTGNANANNNTNTQTESTASDTEGIPAGVQIKKVIKDEELKNNFRKKVELLTDGGKRITITDPNQQIILRHLEYDGVILKVNGDQVTVQVERGGEKTITIPQNIVIDDDEKLGLNAGVEIEWEVDIDGNIQSVELDD